MLVPELERCIGIEVYATSSRGVDGVIRQRVEDFVVEEVLVDGSRAQKNHFPDQVLDSSSTHNQYLICVLVKQGWDTFLALKTIAKQLGISPKQIQIAGIKDAQAVTAQHITLKGISIEEAQKIQIKDIKLCPVGYYRHELSSYYLLGNYFQITIRAIPHSKSRVERRMTKTLKQLKMMGGVPNFFGHQRFGTIRAITHLVGKAIVHGNFKKAAMLYLAQPSPHEHPKSREARQQLQKTQDFHQALKNFPKQLRYERWMLKHLTNNPQDFIGAFRRLPRGLRRLIPQAYQSYLFNRFLSRRIEEELPLNTAEVGDYLVSVERCGRPMLRMHRITTTENVAEINEAVHAGKMRLALPIIGFKQHPSQGIQGSMEQQILEQEDVAMEDFKIEALPEMSLPGRLRATLVPLNSFSVKETSQDQVNPSKIRTEVSFMLYRGSYATVVLREFMKPRNVIESGF